MKSSRRRLAATVVAVGLYLPLVTLSAVTAEAAPGSSLAACKTPLFSSAVKARDVKNFDKLAAAAAVNGQSVTELQRLASDTTLWFDVCGHQFYVEKQIANPDPATGQAFPAATTEGGATTSAAATTASATALRPLSDTFALESKPGAAKTIYLDFDGGTVTGTAWNNSYGDPIVVEPYSATAPADTNFTSAELTEIQKTWQVVAEDYAPFDVNVTTKDLGFDAIEKSTSSDTVYGTRVMITNGGPIYTGCSCGGIAYVNVFNYAAPNHLYFQPAFAFTAGVGSGGKNLGEVSSHEAGHNLGLTHDATASVSYYSGANTWAPIMGVGYYRPVTQWSKGEYPAANNTQDDLLILANGAPLRADDHADNVNDATPLSTTTALNGVISTRTDTDAFGFSANGDTTITVVPADGQPDLDIELSIFDNAGDLVATANPPAIFLSSTRVANLGASWSGTLPAGNYTAFVDGVGTGDPALAGYYSDYASLGNYQISLTNSRTVPFTATATTPPPVTSGSSYSNNPLTVTGGTAPYSFSATGLPSGFSMNSSTGNITGVTNVSGSFAVTAKVWDSGSSATTVPFTLTVVSASGLLATAASTSYSANVGTAFSATPVTATGGTQPYSFAASNLPPGLALTPGSGLISGTPTTAGSYSVTVTVYDNLQDTSRATFTIVVANALVATPTTPPTAIMGASYTATPVSATGGTAPYAFSATGLPAGLTMNSSTGVLSGTPTEAGTFAVTTTVTDNGNATTTADFTLTVNSNIATTLTDPPSATVGRTYSATPVTATGGTSPYVFSATGLPSGLTLSSSTGAISGTPTVAGAYVVTERVTDAAGATDQKTYTLTVVASLVFVTSPTLNTGYLSRTFSQNIVISGGVGPYTWTRSGSLPTGLILTQSTDGLTQTLSGTPTSRGKYQFTLTVTDSRGTAVSRKFNITIK